MAPVFHGNNVISQIALGNTDIAEAYLGNNLVYQKDTAPPDFRPPDIAGNRLWLDADDASSIISSGNRVSEWRDKSGLNNNVIQSDPVNRPSTGFRTIGGKNAITFAVANTEFLRRGDALGFTGNPALSVFFVVRFASPGAGSQTILALGDSPGGQIIRIGENTELGIFYNNGNKYWTAVPTINVPVIYNVSRASGATYQNISGWLNGSLMDQLSSSNPDNLLSLVNTDLVLGSTKPFATSLFDGDIGEVIVYDTQLSEANRNTVTNYLKSKWSIA